jgi:type II secretory pathway component GspD/PulD (secretin)
MSQIARGGAGELADPAPPTRITLPEQADIAGLLILTASTLEIPLEFDPATLKAAGGGMGSTVVLRGVTDVSPTELWMLTNQILASRQLALVRSPNAKVLSLVKLSEAAAISGVQLSTVGPPSLASEAETRQGFVQEIVRPKFRSAKELADSIKPFLTKNAGTAAPVGESGLLLISDLFPRVEEAKRLLETLDVPREDIAPLIIEAKNIPPAALATAVTQLSTKRDTVSGDKLKGELSVAPDGRSLLLVAPAESRESWLRLITALDQREETVTRDYTPKVFSAKEVANLIEQTIRERGGAGPAPAGGQTGGANAAVDDRFRIVTDDLTGTLIVTATPTQHERIAALLERLDATPQSAARPVRAIPIRNRPVNEVLTTLQQLISAGALESPEGIDTSGISHGAANAAVREAGAQRSSRPDEPSQGGIMPVVVPPSAPGTASGAVANRNSNRAMMNSGGGNRTGGISGLSLTADEGTNTLIAIAEPRMLAQLELLIKQLDVRQPQVMLEVYLVSLSEQDAMNLGVELEKIGNFAGNFYQLSSLFGLTTGTPGNRTATAAQGFTGAILNPGDFSAVIKALETISSGSTKSLPKVLVNNNQQALFNSVLQQPYTISNTTSGAGTTTSFGGTQDAGTTISVRPQIAEADQLVLDYSLSLSSFVGAAPASGLPPPRQQNNVSSNATIPDGHTVVVGGIELVSDGRNTTQVPYIGDVPIVGELFKVRDNSQSRQRFYVFIRAAVLRDQQLNDLKYLTDATIRQNGLKSLGVSDGFPTMKPRVIR